MSRKIRLNDSIEYYLEHKRNGGMMTYGQFRHDLDHMVRLLSLQNVFYKYKQWRICIN